jgi:beta-lactam-binding protein with PASTA domain
MNLVRMKSVIRIILLGLVLVMVALISALTAMRFAIHGTEVTVPKLIGLTPAESERAASSLGLNVMIERQYFSPQIPEGRILSQLTDAGTKVRRGWQVRVAQSLGPQRVAIPDVLGESGRAADINIERRGLNLGSIAYIQIPGATPDQVLAQSPPANASGIAVPKISLLVSAASAPVAYIMPSFTGQPLGSVNQRLLDAGFHVGNVISIAPPLAGEPTSTPATSSTAPQSSAPQQAPASSSQPQAPANAAQPNPASIIVSQSPAPGQKVSAGATINFEVR